MSPSLQVWERGLRGPRCHLLVWSLTRRHPPASWAEGLVHAVEGQPGQVAQWAVEVGSSEWRT